MQRITDVALRYLSYKNIRRQWFPRKIKKSQKENGENEHELFRAFFVGLWGAVFITLLHTGLGTERKGERGNCCWTMEKMKILGNSGWKKLAVSRRKCAFLWGESRCVVSLDLSFSVRFLSKFVQPDGLAHREAKTAKKRLSHIWKINTCRVHINNAIDYFSVLPWLQRRKMKRSSTCVFCPLCFCRGIFPPLLSYIGR